jgi:hypothetical protein
MSERSDFIDVSWKTYRYPITFTLSAGNGLKRIYFQTRDAYFSQSDVVSDTIQLIPVRYR